MEKSYLCGQAAEPLIFETIGACVDRMAATYPDKEAIVVCHQDIRWTFKEYQAQVIKNAQAMSAALARNGYRIVSGGTDDHLFLVDLIGREVTGKDAEETLGRAHITLNKNAVPNDPRSPFVTSGLRIGSPAGTTRGFKEAEMVQIAGWICDILDALQSGDAEATVDRVRAQVAELCARFPVYG